LLQVIPRKLLSVCAGLNPVSMHLGFVAATRSRVNIRVLDSVMARRSACSALGRGI